MKKLSFSLICCCLSSYAFAQTNTESEAFWVGTLTKVTLSQQASLAGSQLTTVTADQVMLSQQGNTNQLTYLSTGVQAGNMVSFVQQGDNNRLNLALTGSRSTYSLAQLGSGNDLQLTNMQGDNVRLEVRQSGFNNSLITTGVPFGAATSPIRIEQSGGARAIVTTTYQ
jgi:hypothetical protein